MKRKFGRFTRQALAGVCALSMMMSNFTFAYAQEEYTAPAEEVVVEQTVEIPDEIISETFSDDCCCDDCCEHEHEDEHAEEATEQVIAQEEVEETAVPVAEEVPEETPVEKPVVGLKSSSMLTLAGAYAAKPNSCPDCGSKLTTVNETYPTCTVDGHTEYKYCKKCGYTSDYEIKPAEHKWNNGTITTYATCLEPGVRTYECVRYGCNETKTEPIQATGHDFRKQNNKSKSATCGEDGYDYYYCTHYPCTETKTVPVLATGNHLYTNFNKTVVEPTCTEQGYTAYKCARCGNVDKRNLKDPLGHAWNNGEVTTQPTYHEEGVKTFKCTRQGCNETKTEPIAKLACQEHNYVVDASKSKAATCQEAGLEVKVCSNCGDKVTTNLPKVNHNFTNLVGRAEPWCESEGYKLYKCEWCSQTERRDIVPPTGHIPEDVDEVPATCEEDGHKAGTKCSDCGKILSGCEEIPTTGHDWQEVKERKATCGDNGHSAYRICLKCEAKEGYEFYKATGHNYSQDIVVVEEPTCTTNGVRGRVCSKCGWVIDVDVLSKKGHDFSIDVPEQKATCTEDGHSAYKKCSRCDATEGYEVYKAEGHDMTKHLGTEYNQLNPGVHEVVEVYGCQNCDDYGEPSKVTTTEDCNLRVVTSRYKNRNDMAHRRYWKQVCDHCGYESNENYIEEAHVLEYHDGQAATCTENGWEAYDTCKCCDYTSYKEIPAGHVFIDVPEQKATCTEGGCSAYQKCKNCGYIPVEPTNTPPFGGDHMYSFNRTIKEATCSEDGINEYKCARCGDLTTRTTIKTAHKFGLSYDVVITEPTCTSSGLKQVYHDCTICHEKVLVQDNVVMGYSEHEYGEYEFVPGSNCQERNKMVRTCKKCSHEDAKYVDEFGYSLGYGEHDFEGNYVPDGNATCQSVGTQTAHCKNSGCSATDTKPGDTLGDHVWSTNSTVDKEPTCCKYGSRSFHCTLCDEKGTPIIIPKTNKHNLKWVIIEESTCTEQGQQKQVCQNEGCTYETTPSPKAALGHNWSTEYTIDRQPTCLNFGLKSRHCTRCEAWTDQQQIEKLPHDYEFLYELAPNCELDGRKYFKCKVCEAPHSEKTADKLGHDFEWVTIKEATCTEDGSRKQVCKREGCNAYTVPETIPASGHQFGEWYVAEEATCQEAGLKRRDCKNCSHYETEVIPKEKNHKYEIFVEKVEPTCTEEGYLTYKCKWCGKTRNQHKVEPLGHDFENGTEIKRVEPTCTKDGYYVMQCSRCNATETYTLNKLGHKYGEWYTSKEATCTELGYERRDCQNEGCHSYQSHALNKLGHDMIDVPKKDSTCTEDGYEAYKKCTRCEYTEGYEVIPAKGHDFENGTEIERVEPTCTKDGYYVMQCSRCNATETYTLNATGHKYGEWYTSKEPTCTELGYERHDCKNEGCNSYQSRAINKLGHNLIDVPKKDATCTEDGHTAYKKCSRCEYTEGYEVINAIPHNYGEWYITIEPTCTRLGFERHDCKNDGCHYYESHAINKLGHDLIDVPKKDSTCLEDGYEAYKKCTRCEYTEGYEVIPAKGHDFTVYVKGSDTYESKDKASHTHYWTNKCSRCEETEIEQEVLKHNFVMVDDKKPTCEEKGYTTYKCKECNYKYTAEVSALGHSYGNLTKEIVKTPTTESEGRYEEVKYCERCNDRYVINSGIIPKLEKEEPAPLPAAPAAPAKTDKKPVETKVTETEETVSDVTEAADTEETVTEEIAEEVVPEAAPEITKEEETPEVTKAAAEEPEAETETEETNAFCWWWLLLILIVLIIATSIVIYARRKNNARR